MTSRSSTLFRPAEDELAGLRDAAPVARRVRRFDAKAARAVIERDDDIDRLYDRIFHDLLDRMSRDAAAAGRAARLLLVAKHLERIEITSPTSAS